MNPVRVVVATLLVIGVGLAGYWAGRVALEPPDDPLDVVLEPTEYRVESGSVGRSLSFTSVASWDLQSVGVVGGPGVVTSVEISAGDQVDAGDVVFTRDLRPVVIAEGTVPMFRDLGVRDEGADVAQLQTMLVSLDYYAGAVDGVYGDSTRDAVRNWQESLGLEPTGSVNVGDVVFVPDLPVRVAPADQVSVGARLVGGEALVSVIPADPVFRIPLATEQAALVPLTAPVLVSYPDGVWDARIDRAVDNLEPGRLDLFLSGPDGGSVCGNMCTDWVQLTGQSHFRTKIVVIPETEGPLVPVGAISAGAGNQSVLTLADGSQVEVTVVESANGVAVVAGIEVGTEILLPQRNER